MFLLIGLLLLGVGAGAFYCSSQRVEPVSDWVRNGLGYWGPIIMVASIIIGFSMVVAEFLVRRDDRRERERRQRRDGLF